MTDAKSLPTLGLAAAKHSFSEGATLLGTQVILGQHLPFAGSAGSTTTVRSPFEQVVVLQSWEFQLFGL